MPLEIKHIDIHPAGGNFPGATTSSETMSSSTRPVSARHQRRFASKRGYNVADTLKIESAS